MTPAPESNEIQSQVDLLFADYLDNLDQGSDFDRERFLQSHPEHANDLRELIEANEIFVGICNDAGLGQADLSQTSLLDETTNRTIPKQQYLGDYELLEEIARGGMGVVYKARQLSLGRIVAIKMIRYGDLATADDILRFRNEAESIANLNHQNIVAVHEVGEHEGQYYFSMTYVEGGCLSQLVREHPLPDREAAAILKQAAEAVQHAHDQGVLHRDIKPANILIDGNGDVQITDFGLAKRAGNDSSLTETGQVLGTPGYMPPEQAAGNHKLIGPASDVYSLGAVLFELLTSRPPFVAPTPMETIRQVLEQDALSPRLLNATVSKDLETICLKSLEKSPGQRYQTPKELAEELDRYLQGIPIQARPMTRITRAWRWCRRNPFAAQLIAATAAFLIFVTIESLWLAKQQERMLIDEVQRHNRSAANWVATLVEMELDDWRQAVLRAAAELELSHSLLESLHRGKLSRDEMKKQIDEFDPDKNLQGLCEKWYLETEKTFHGVFNSWYVFNKEGTIVALWPSEAKDSIGKRYSGREYFRHHLTSPRKGNAHVSLVFLSENDDIFKYAISAPLIDVNGDLLGVVAGSISVGPTLGKHKLSETRQKVVVVGRGDPNPARTDEETVAQQYKFPILIHDEYEPGQEPVEFSSDKLWLPATATTEDNHADPIYGGRWLAAYEPVEDTEFRVVVQQLYEEAIPPILGRARSLVFWLGAGLTFGILLMAAVSNWLRRARVDLRT